MTLEDIYRLLKASHVQAQGIVDTIDQPLLVLDEALCVVNANPAFLTAFHVSRDDTLSQKLCNLGNGQWNIPELTRLLDDVIPKAAAVIGYEVSHSFPVIGRRTMLVTARRLVHPDSNSIFMLVAFDDVTDRRREEGSRDLLLHEIEHRLRNFMSMVLALARQVPAEGETVLAYRQALLSRLEAMVRAELGIFTNGDGDLAEVLTAALSPYRDRIRLDQAKLVKLTPAQGRSFSMLLHELATNATKFGALSSPGGAVRVGWQVSEEGGRRLVFDWMEEGGPAITKPDHEGFGTRLIKALVKDDLGGTLERNFEPAGLRARITFPLAPA